MTKDQVITVRKIDNGWVASYHTSAPPYVTGEFYAASPHEALDSAIESIGKAEAP